MTTHVRLARGCYLDESEANTFAARCAAALEVCDARTFLISTTSGRLHRLWLPPGLQEIHLATSVPSLPGRRMSRTRRPQFRGHRLQLNDCDVTQVDGLPVMTVARTWRSLAGVLALPDLVAAGDSALRLGTSVAELDEVMRRTAGHRHAVAAREALSLLDGRSRSRPESHLRVALAGPDMPRFEVNVAVGRDEGGWLAEPDLSLAGAKLALEYQGEDHGGTQRMRKDITRAKDMREQGWLVHPYGPAEVFGRPWAIRAQVRSDIQRRGPTCSLRAPQSADRPCEWPVRGRMGSYNCPFGSELPTRRRSEGDARGGRLDGKSP